MHSYAPAKPGARACTTIQHGLQKDLSLQVSASMLMHTVAVAAEGLAVRIPHVTCPYNRLNGPTSRPDLKPPLGVNPTTSASFALALTSRVQLQSHR